MLLLTRKEKQSIIIDENIYIKVVHICTDESNRSMVGIEGIEKVEPPYIILGIEAPKEITVNRKKVKKELLEDDKWNS